MQHFSAILVLTVPALLQVSAAALPGVSNQECGTADSLPEQAVCQREDGMQ